MSVEDADEVAEKERAQHPQPRLGDWDAGPFEIEGGGDSTTLHRGGEDQSIGGLMDIRGRVPDEVPANWLVYFAVDDLHATAARAGELARVRRARSGVGVWDQEPG